MSNYSTAIKFMAWCMIEYIMWMYERKAGQIKTLTEIM